MDNSLDPVIAKLDKIISLLERLVPEETKDFSLPDFSQSASSCKKCNIPLEGVMGYVCNHVDCPTGLGPVTC